MSESYLCEAFSRSLQECSISRATTCVTGRRAAYRGLCFFFHTQCDHILSMSGALTEQTKEEVVETD